MPIPGPGVPISMTTIATEFGGTVPHSLSEYYRGGGLVPNTPTNAAIPTSGTIAMGNFYGSANRATVNLTIGADTANYDVWNNTSGNPGYVAGSTDVTVTVNPGVTVSAGGTGSYAMLVPSSFNPGDSVQIVNNGTIIGAGGNGGTGGRGGQPGQLLAGQPGGGGGQSLYVNRPTSVTNNGTIAGGGGGGGGGGGSGNGPAASSMKGGGGGGGAGVNGGAGGAAGPNAGGAPAATPGQPGTSTTGGAGGAGGGPVPGRPPNPGGPGGGRGAAGTAGSNGNNTGGGAGGGAGNYIVGNSFVTWQATGTRQGGVA